MDFTLYPWQLYFLILAGWVNRQQQYAIEYLRTENQVLREKVGRNRILLSDDQRRRLAAKGKLLGRKLLQDVGTVFTPDTILRWHRNWSLGSGITATSGRRSAGPGFVRSSWT